MSELLPCAQSKEFLDWLKSPQGMQCQDKYILHLESYHDVLLNRLNAAFEAGRQSAPEKCLESAYKEGWEAGWVDRNVDSNNDQRVSPWLPPKQQILDDWNASLAKSLLPAPPEKAQSEWRIITHENWDMPPIGKAVIVKLSCADVEIIAHVDQEDSEVGGGQYYWDGAFFEGFDESPLVQIGDRWAFIPLPPSVEVNS